MDMTALQVTLRAFAAERNWEQFHTPKNLTMALMVEAAELMELFQWQTAEESCSAKLDAKLKMRIGEELADVLLYLLQLADHTEIDLELAVADKLQKNANKHPIPGARAASQT
jgi:NTP pyrophosphatase (non-canonical NTP hydrolase)